jgi:hypothetical protein
MKRIALAVVLGAVLGAGQAAAAGGSSDQDAGPAAVVSFVVLKDYNGKPVRNAGVVMHQVDKKDKQEKGGLELKTDAEGKASFDGVPYGKLRVQVLSPGLQTFGQDYDIDQPTVEITIKLKRPGGQYSIYDDHPGDKDNKAPSPSPAPAPPPDAGGKPQ